MCKGKKPNNITYRNNGYNEGYADGIASSTSNAEIQYTYHSHVDFCYTGGYKCGAANASYTHRDGDYACWLYYCVAGHATSTNDFNSAYAASCQYYVPQTTICGKTTSTIETATIIFN